MLITTTMLSRRTRLGYYGRTGTVLQRVMLWVCGFVCPSVPKVARLTSITDENVPQRSVYCQISGAGSLAVARTADFLVNYPSPVTNRRRILFLDATYAGGFVFGSVRSSVRGCVTQNSLIYLK